MAAEFDPKHHVVDNSVSVAQLDCTTAFAGLTPQERLYAHYIGRASWEGAKICLLQCSAESPAIFALLQRLFAAQSAAALGEAAAKAGVDADDVKAFVVYAAAFYSNCGNYRSFGDSKIIPGCSQEAFTAIVKASAAYAADAAAVDALLADVGDLIFDLSPRLRGLGLGADKGVSAYYSSNVTLEDAQLVQRFMDGRHLSAYNTRLFKDADGNFELRQAAAEGGAAPGFEEPVEFEGRTIRVVRGDYGALMARVADNLDKAAAVAANDEQKAMLAKYSASFRGGSVEDHIEGSRHWIRDKGPSVESYIGFIESYRDPLGVRGEWEGFVAVVNREMSAKFATLVEAAPALLPKLPWGPAYEKDVFQRPDFTSLEVVAFGSSGIPAGINIPNYDVVRQGEGFKNVSLGNVLSARDLKERVTFIHDDDQEAFRSTLVPSFEVQVGLHELLGHGSGKLFRRNEDGTTNFDAALINPETGAPVASCYAPGQTYDAAFPVISSSLEECRAECVGVYLCVDKDVLKIFGHEGDEGDRIVYVNWLSMARAGLMALLFYSPETKKHGQAHMQARFAILRVMIEAGVAEIVNAERAAGGGAGGAGEGKHDDEPELGVYVKVHEDRIRTAGVAAVGAFLRKIQTYKATADYAAAKALYDRYTTVPDDMLPLRDLVVRCRKPRPFFVQPHTMLVDGGDDVALREFEPSAEGVVASFAARYPATDDELEGLWRKDFAAIRA
eukprot:CAMPEP_0203815534 /NCGR_PEP_ID=MMETSP0115-20131106/11160_1 /ASSEMBLY_ACC=CAM_ASM_000227 /TAXON_ID=33651 /ORGANISM="Bicosoecid sp, Strain ms1" /LENGTH=727 /DNA_ID=CAMNT_0050724431 /DNA_START=24 /DNA_END=2207 /DNA_ORIENTATION=-